MNPWIRIKGSPWPSLCAMNLSMSLLAMVYYFWGATFEYMAFSFFLTILPACLWLSDVIREGTFWGIYPKPVIQGLGLCFYFFIISELMFFWAFFGAFFHSGLCPSKEFGGDWPPYGIVPIYPFAVPGLNLVILVASSLTANCSRDALRASDKWGFYLWSIVTMSLGLWFLKLQYTEYMMARFTICDSVYGSTFYMLTGLHGFHVMLGMMGLFFVFLRQLFKTWHNGTNVGIWAITNYWHFVDGVWAVVWFFVYFWGGYSFFKYPLVEWVYNHSHDFLAPFIWGWGSFLIFFLVVPEFVISSLYNMAPSLFTDSLFLVPDTRNLSMMNDWGVHNWVIQSMIEIFFVGGIIFSVFFKLYDLGAESRLNPFPIKMYDEDNYPFFFFFFFLAYVFFSLCVWFHFAWWAGPTYYTPSVWIWPYQPEFTAIQRLIGTLDTVDWAFSAPEWIKVSPNCVDEFFTLDHHSSFSQW